MTKKRCWPTFKSEFLDDISNSLSRKSKSIKNTVSSYSCDKVYEIDGEQKIEKLELVFFLLGANKVRITIDIWDSRWAWIDIRLPSKSGWVFEWQKEGRVGYIEAKDFTDTVLKTIRLPYLNSDSSHLQKMLEEIWKKITINGPLGIVG